MPYLGELAKNQGNQKLMSELAIQEIFKDVKIIRQDMAYLRLDNYTMPEEEQLKLKDSPLKYIVVIDGSKYETSLPDYPDITVGLVNVNQCIIDMEKLQNYLKNSFPLPQEYQKIKENIALSSVVPLKGLCNEDHRDEKDFFRFFVYQTLKTMTNPVVQWLEQQGYEIKHQETLLETYKNLLNHLDKLPGFIQTCPHCKKAGRSINIKSFRENNNVFNYEDTIRCRCDLEPQKIYITDLLQFHEQFNNEKSNESMTTQMMLVLERLTLLNLIRILKHNGLEKLFDEIAFIMDGSLAIYSHASWLSSAINAEIIAIKDKHPLLIIGIEKTGNFVDHFKKMDNFFTQPVLKNGMIFFLNDSYIKEHIKIYDNEGFYGEKNYFGKKFFYKNTAGKLFTVNIAFDSEADRAVNYNVRNEVDKIKSTIGLDKVLMLLDNFASHSYTNALSFISMANEGAALSSSYMGKRLLDNFIKSMFGHKQDN
jgi:hypothetical protein